MLIADEQAQSELKAAGYTGISVDRETLPYQYVIKAR